MTPRRSLTDSGIDAFTDWFTSPLAFVQGVAVTAVWIGLVALGIDAHGWWLLFGLTVFSGVTQFPLAYAARRASEASDRALTEIDTQTELIEQMLRNQADTLTAILELVRHQQATEKR